jgi:hypothetical protein
MAPNLLLAIGGGAISALFFLSVMAGGGGALVLAYMAPLPLLMLGLGPGLSAALLGGVAATALVGLASNLLAALAFALANLLPALLVVRQALLARTGADGSLEWYPPGLLVTALAGYGVALLLAAAMLTAGETGGLEGAVREALEGTLGAISQGLAGPGTTEADALAGFVDVLVPVFPALVVISWLAMTVVNGALAQGLLMRFGRNRRPPMRMAMLSLPPWAPAALAVVGLAAVLLDGGLGYLAVNAALVLLVPFFFAGLAVVHALAARRGSKPLVLVLFYLFLLLFQWVVPLVVGLGLIEQWAGLRQRFAQAGPHSEDV